MVPGQVKGHERIFGMGDVMLHEGTREIKLGHTAEASHRAALPHPTHQRMATLPSALLHLAQTPRLAAPRKSLLSAPR